VELLEQRKKTGPITLVSRWWATFADVEFLLSGSVNFERLEMLDSLPGPKLMLLNFRADVVPDEVTCAAKDRMSSVVFAAGSYELVEVP
jgi:hypothetical protein